MEKMIESATEVVLVGRVTLAQRAQLATIGIEVSPSGLVFGAGWSAPQLKELLDGEGIVTGPHMIPYPPPRRY